MIKIKKKNTNSNSVQAYARCDAKGCATNCPPTGISSGTVQNYRAS